MEREDWNQKWTERGGVADRHSHGPDGLLEPNAPKKPGRAIDFGCGQGANAIWLAKRGWEVTASDFSDVALEQARMKAAKAGVSLNTASIDLRQDEIVERYDLVTLFYVHLWPEERRVALKRAADVVAPGGTLLFVAHDKKDRSFFTRHQNHDIEKAEQEGESAKFHRKREELEAILTDPEEVAAELSPYLEIIRAETVQHDPHCAGEDAPTTLVIATRPL